MDNPFEVLDHKLNKIIDLLEEASKIKDTEKNHTEYDIMSIEETASYLGCFKQTLYHYTSTRMIPHFKINRRVMFRKDDIIKWITEHKVKTSWEIEQEADDYIIKKTGRYRS
jgi:excisionase family DNA binding protein